MSVFSAITPEGCESKAQNLGDLLVQSAGGACDLAIRGVESAFSAIAHYGPGLAGSTLGAANDAVSSVNEAFRGFGDAVSDIAAPKPAADNSPFANLGIDFGSLNLGVSMSQDVAFGDFNHGIAGLGASKSQGWSLAA
jgi:hypothetical protein